MVDFEQDGLNRIENIEELVKSENKEASINEDDNEVFIIRKKTFNLILEHLYGLVDDIDDLKSENSNLNNDVEDCGDTISELHYELDVINGAIESNLRYSKISDRVVDYIDDLLSQIADKDDIINDLKKEIDSLKEDVSFYEKT